MPRLTSADVAKLLDALRTEAPTPSQGQAPPVHAQPPSSAQTQPAENGETAAGTAPERHAAGAIAPPRTDPKELAAVLGAALRGYFGRDVAVEIETEPHLPANPLRFEAGESPAWHLDLDAPLAAALVDIA
ncbi:MAG: hypothetical protein JO347_02035, partial [Candidatus Eremiobacteraeota bacterium]|nr:hypothetical protein [Candidatus Eremiobacteraeota bacterium]